MNQEVILWIIGTGITITGIVVGGYVSLIQRVTRLETRFETTLDMIGHKVAKKLHSPDDHHGIDWYLDKYLRREELTLEEWMNLKDRCVSIAHSNKVIENEKLLADFMEAICDHKIRCHTRYQEQLLNK
jgi:hypothetical protein